MADERRPAADGVSDEDIAAAVGEELPDGPEEFGLATDSASDTFTPPGQSAVDPAPPELAES